MSRLSLAALLLLPLAVACGKDDGEDNTDENVDGMPYCEDVASEMAPEDVSAFGLSGQAFLDSIPVEMVGAVDFADVGAVGLSVEFIVDASSLRSIASEAVYPETDGPVPDIAVICPARVEADAQIRVFSEDGRLAEQLEVVLSSSDPAELGGPEGEVVFFVDLDQDALEGSLDLADFADVGSYDEVSLSLSGSLLDHELMGELAAMGERVDGNAASATVIPVASLEATLPVD